MATYDDYDKDENVQVCVLYIIYCVHCRSLYVKKEMDGDGYCCVFLLMVVAHVHVPTYKCCTCAVATFLLMFVSRLDTQLVNCREMLIVVQCTQV